MSVPLFFMNIMTSSGRTFPFESVPTVKSSALIACRVASETRSAYCGEILAASFMIFWSRETARSCAAA